MALKLHDMILSPNPFLSCRFFFYDKAVIINMAYTSFVLVSPKLFSKTQARRINCIYFFNLTILYMYMVFSFEVCFGLPVTRKICFHNLFYITTTEGGKQLLRGNQMRCIIIHIDTKERLLFGSFVQRAPCT